MPRIVHISMVAGVALGLIMTGCSANRSAAGKVDGGGESPARTTGIVVRLGNDTVQIERLTRRDGLVAGTTVQRLPSIRIVEWSLSFDKAGAPVRYDSRARDASGKAILDGYSGAIIYGQDSITRIAYAKGVPDTARMATPAAPYVLPFLPYLGVSFAMHEFSFRDARRRALAHATDTVTFGITLLPAVKTVSSSRAWLVGDDSTQLNYFNVARSGYRFDARGELLRADWTATTYRYKAEQVSALPFDSLLTRWSKLEQGGIAFGPASPRDSSKGSVGSAHVSIDYSRPAARGRVIWGDLVPWDKVWRLGADLATHFATSTDLTIGGVHVPAGRYTLWMVPSETNPLLVVSKAVNIFGTGYRPTADLARIPMTRAPAAQFAERLTLSVGDGALRIAWGDALWSVAVGQ